MTTKPRGITLPEYAFIDLSLTGVQVTDTEQDYTVKNAYSYGPGNIFPVNTTAPSTSAPSDFQLKAQNANAAFAAGGGNLKLVPGKGTGGNSSGHCIIRDGDGNGGSYNKSHIVMGNYHLWFDAKERLRIKSSQPATDEDGVGVGYSYEASDTWNPGSIANGAADTKVVAVAGAVLGDYVLCSFSLNLQGLQMTGYVSGGGNVTVILNNATGGAIDLASGTVKVRVIKQ